ncbi:UNVERIFIED_CONTAM: tc3a [Trichonephila clavipes]
MPRMAVNDRTASSRQLAAHESRFNLWDHDCRIRVRRSAGELCLPESVIERHSGLTSAVIQDNARPHVSNTVRDFYSAQQMQLLPWAAYSSDVFPIEYVWDLTQFNQTYSTFGFDLLY